nr:MAG TPA: hypothetical protein [Caudoviricetes sp.]
MIGMGEGDFKSYHNCRTFNTCRTNKKKIEQ